MRVAVWLGLCVGVVIDSPQSLNAQTLERFEDQFHKDHLKSSDKEKKPPRDDDEDTSHDPCDDSDDVFRCLFIQPLVDALGHAFTLRYLWPPAPHWSLDLTGRVGSIEEHALWDLRERLGVHLGPIELFGGFRPLRGPAEELNGPDLGFAVWF